MSTLKDPTHPGEVLAELFFDLESMTITDYAEHLGVSRNTLSQLLNGRRGISPDMAFRLSQAFGNTPDVWMKMQMTYDLAQHAKEEKGWKKVKKLEGVDAA